MKTDAKKRAAWRKWYAANKQKMAKYYKKRYQARRKSETVKDRNKRLKKQREYYAAYAKKNRTKINKQRKARRAQAKK